MKGIKFNINIDKSVIKFSNFARALALPVRVCTIRVILENGNAATREMLHQIPFNEITVNKHINELKHLGIIKSVRKDRITFFSVNEDVFIQMSNNFLTLFESIGQLNEEAKSIVSRPRLKRKRAIAIVEEAPIQRFGEYIKEKRKAMGILQDDLSIKLKIDRSQLSKIECNKKTLKPKKIKTLAELLQIPLTEITKIYYQDKMLKLNNENESILNA
jgi:DNA-binding XRE family transcriptional regulator